MALARDVLERCPTPEILRNLLSGESEPSAALEAHLETCPRCQQTLDQLSRDDTDWQANAPETPWIPDPELWRRLQSLVGTKTTSPSAAATAFGESLPAIPGYRLFAVLGQGGMGIVYEGVQEGLGRRVAVKTLRADKVNDELKARMRREAEAIARLNHPNIVQVYEVGEWQPASGGPPLPYLAMERVAGQPLGEWLGGQPQPAELAAEMVETLARAVHAAHQAGIVHRDLKPGNILVSVVRGPLSVAKDMKDSRGDERITENIRSVADGPGDSCGDGQRTTDNGRLLKITDFGLAKDVEAGASLTDTGQVVGTPNYMAPEQVRARSEEIGPAADIHALGAILYELLTSRPPFVGKTPMETLLQVISAEPVSPRQLLAAIPRDLETICMKCLEKEPARRYLSAEALADDLLRFRRGEPIAARPAGRLERLGRWCRRKPALAAAVGLAAVLLLALAVVGSVLAITSRQAAADMADANTKLQDQQNILKAQNQQLLGQETEIRETLKIAETRLEERDREQRQREQEEKKRRRFERVSAVMALERGITLCEGRDPCRGLLWMARGLELVPEGAADLDQVIRANLAVCGASTEYLVTRFDHNIARTLVFVPEQEKAVSLDLSGVLSRWDLRNGKLISQSEPSKLRMLYALSPDGRIALLQAFGLDFCFWDVAAQRPPGAFFSPSGFPTHITFSSDSRQALLTSGNSILLFEVPVGKRVGNGLNAASAIRTQAFDTARRRFVAATLPSASSIGILEIDPATGKHSEERVLAHPVGVQRVLLSPDGRYLATAGADNATRLWDVASGQLQGKAVPHKLPVTHLGFSPDSRWFVASDNLGVKLVACRGPEIVELENSGGYRELAFSPDGKAVMSAQGNPLAWDIASGKLLHYGVPSESIAKAAFAANGDLILLSRAGPDKPALWRCPSVETGRYPLPSIKRTAFGLARDGSTLVLHVGPNQGQLWDLKNSRALGEPFPCLQTLYSPNGSAILALGSDRQVRLLDAAKGSLLAPPMAHDGVLGGACFDETGQRAAWWGGTTIRLADIARRKLDGPECVYPQRDGIALSPDGKILFSWKYGEVRRWDAATGAPLGAPWTHLIHYGFALAFPPNAKTVVVGASDAGSLDGQARLWERDLADGRLVGEPLVLPQALVALGFFGRTSNLLTATVSKSKGDLGQIRCWDWATKQPITPVIRFPGLRAAVPADDGETILAWSDATWQLWHRSTGLPLTPPFHHRQNLVEASFGTSPRSVVVRDFFHNLRVVNVPAPKNGSVEEVVNWAQAATGLELDAAGVVRDLDPDTWSRKRQGLGKK